MAGGEFEPGLKGREGGLSRPLSQIDLEREAGHQRACALPGSRCLRNNGAEATAVQAGIRAGSELRGSIGEGPDVDGGAEPRVLAVGQIMRLKILVNSACT